MRSRRVFPQMLDLRWPDRLLIVEILLDVFFVKSVIRSPWRQVLLQQRPTAAVHQDELTGCQTRHIASVCELSFAVLPLTCLERALLLQRLLRRRGVETRLQIGVRMQDGALEAHAWLDHPALPKDNQQQHFSVLALSGAKTAALWK